MATFDENTFVQVRIQEKTEYGEFNDSLYFTFDEFSSLKDDVVMQMKADRVASWAAFVKEQSAIDSPEPTSEELQAQKEALIEQVAKIDQQIFDTQMEAAVVLGADEIIK